MILDELAEHARKRVKDAKALIGLEELKSDAKALPKGDLVFEKALGKKELTFICELKKASPSRGIIDPEFNYLDILSDYEAGGADCISCLTEPRWFCGSDEIFKNVRKKTALPMLRKDFTVDEYQIYEAKMLGADAVLLICALLPAAVIERYLDICNTLGICALVEAHGKEEIRSALSAGARIIGVNNRNLKNFTVDTGNVARLRELIPPGVLYVAESGLRNPQDVLAAAKAGADGVLIGEALMCAPDRTELLQKFKEAAKEGAK